MSQMSNFKYDESDPESILDFAAGLSGRSLEDIFGASTFADNDKHKGHLGQLVERYYFNHVPPNDHNPDFPDAGIELKTTGVRRNKLGKFRAKERLVLMLINYVSIVDEEWESCSLMAKCRTMLLLFYLYEPDTSPYRMKFVYNPLLWEFPENDLKVIEADWKQIQKKIADGRAHELSEGDTFYLGACRKGSGGTRERLQKQPHSSARAPSRAFALKASYLNTILENHATESNLLDTPLRAGIGIERVTHERLRPYLDKSVNTILANLNWNHANLLSKGFYKSLSMRMLGVKGKTVPEFEKAGIEVKAIRLNRQGIPNQHISFPAFDYLEIVKTEWEDSNFFANLEKKFLFIIFQYDSDGTLRFKGAKFWNMPYADREEAHRVWSLTKRQIAKHKAAELPKSSESKIAHVRPHGKNSADVLLTPEGKLLPRKGFWLHRQYIAEQLALVEDPEK